MTEAEQGEHPDLLALSLPPSKRVCAFTSMTSFGSHYRVDMEEAGPRHVTFDSGVAEIGTRRRGSLTSNCVQADLARVGVLKNILVLCYGNLSLVLMVVSWVAKHTEERPRLRRDAHGFWLANMAARPRDTTNPYILPALASQVVHTSHPLCCASRVGSAHRTLTPSAPNHGQCLLQVFFVEDKAMTGWSVVLQKENRSKRINSTEEEHGLGQEVCSDDLEVFRTVEPQRRGPADSIGRDQDDVRQSNGRRRNWNEVN